MEQSAYKNQKYSLQDHCKKGKKKKSQEKSQIEKRFATLSQRAHLTLLRASTNQ